MKVKSFIVALMLVAAMCFSSCSSTSDGQEIIKKQCQITGIASKLGGIVNDDSPVDDQDLTRSIFYGGKEGESMIIEWDYQERVVVYKNGIEIAELTPDEYGVKTTTLKGEIYPEFSNTIAVGDVLTLFVPQVLIDFREQQGSLVSISNLTGMVAEATVTSVEGLAVTTSEMLFSTQCTYYRIYPRAPGARLIEMKKVTISKHESEDNRDNYFVGEWDMLADTKTQTDEIVLEMEKIDPTNTKSYTYPTMIYLGFMLTSSKIVVDYTIEDVDGNIWRASSKTLSNAPGQSKVARFEMECINVDAGVSTGITPPSDEDVTIDDVTKE